MSERKRKQEEARDSYHNPQIIGIYPEIEWEQSANVLLVIIPKRLIPLPRVMSEITLGDKESGEAHDEMFFSFEVRDVSLFVLNHDPRVNIFFSDNVSRPRSLDSCVRSWYTLISVGVNTGQLQGGSQGNPGLTSARTGHWRGSDGTLSTRSPQTLTEDLGRLLGHVRGGLVGRTLFSRGIVHFFLIIPQVCLELPIPGNGRDPK